MKPGLNIETVLLCWLVIQLVFETAVALFAVSEWAMEPTLTVLEGWPMLVSVKSIFLGMLFVAYVVLGHSDAGKTIRIVIHWNTISLHLLWVCLESVIIMSILIALKLRAVENEDLDDHGHFHDGNVRPFTRSTFMLYSKWNATILAIVILYFLNLRYWVGAIQEFVTLSGGRR